MTDHEIRDVLEQYATDLAYEHYAGNKTLAHCRQMIPQMQGFLVEGRREKVFRWLGFIQGVLYAENVYTICEMAQHNRSHEA